MGARQSKRSVDISAGATKTEKGPSGEPLENGTITTASTDEKQAVEANGGVEETPKQNGSTPHVDEKEIAETASNAEEVKETVKTDEEKTESAAPAVVSESNGDLDSTVDESAKSPTDETTEVPASAEKKRKKKKSWSFRSISFSKKDKPKPTIKEQATTDVKTETVPEVVEEEIVKEEAKPKFESPVEVPKDSEESPAVVEEKETATEINTTNVNEIPPPLPSSPPPVETPAVPTPTIVETPAPIQPVEPEIPQVEPEDDTVGGGEGLAEPPEGLNTSDIEKEVAEVVPLVNGNHVEDEKSELASDVNCLSEKIEAIKLSNAADISDMTNELSNDSHEVNGMCDTIAVTNGDGGHGGDD